MIKFVKENSTLFCIPQEEIIATNVPAMRDILIAHLDSDDSWEQLVLDCKSIETLDSIGVNLIVGLFKKAKATNKIFSVVGCNSSILKVLKLFRLDEQFQVKAR
ncbi:MAG: hypothetical protein COB67_06445 [SAR324 cluster bacterium]|uniref:STAS domain-containing protein n=1 Tax=SAR324 cluster bacterium TaxID=2024889 RepID=A0A2A4T5Y8_9DELT|nr:MAG: hypothetical protein COB67_06445 [SAR324 cluster bacterium]